MLRLSVCVFPVSIGLDFSRSRLLLLQRNKSSEPTFDGSRPFARDDVQSTDLHRARQKFDHFFADQAERSVTLSNVEVNALLADSPELRILKRGTVVLLTQNSAEVHCSLPVDPSVPTATILELHIPDASLGARRTKSIWVFHGSKGRANPWDPQKPASINSLSCPSIEKTVVEFEQDPGRSIGARRSN